MKKNCLIMFVTGVLCLPVFSQKNATKINLFPGPLFRMFSISQERAINDRLSIQVTFRDMPPKTFNGINSVSYNGQAYNPFTSAKLSAFGGFAELRVYGAEKKALHGFYWGPYINYTTYKLVTNTFPASFTDQNGVTYSADVKEYFKLNIIALGLQIGLQKITKNGFLIDWTILGLGFSSIGIKGGLEASNVSTDFDFTNYTSDIDKATFGLDKYLPIRRSIHPTKVEFGIRTLSMHLKTGLAIGFGY